MNTADIPFMKEPDVADTKSTDAKATDAKGTDTGGTKPVKADAGKAVPQNTTQERDLQTDQSNIEGKPSNQADLEGFDKEYKERMTAKAAPAPAGPFARAAESSDPAVHKLMADRQTAAMNGDKDTADAVSDELRKLGFE